MSNLSIKDVPEALAQSLRQRAARNHRSLQGELMAIIEQAVMAGEVAESFKSGLPNVDRLQPTAQQGHRQGNSAGYDRMGRPTTSYGWKTIEQITDEIDAQPKETRPVYPPGIALGVDIIRAERDAR